MLRLSYLRKVLEHKQKRMSMDSYLLKKINVFDQNDTLAT